MWTKNGIFFFSFLGAKIVIALLWLNSLNLFKFRKKNYFLDENFSDELNSLYSAKPDPMGQQIYAIIDHFKDPDPIGLPVPIPDPIESNEPVEQNLSIGKLVMKDAQIHGVSKFRIQNITVEMDKRMEASCCLVFDTLVMRGNYSLSSFFTKSNGMKYEWYVKERKVFSRLILILIARFI